MESVVDIRDLVVRFPAGGAWWRRFRVEPDRPARQRGRLPRSQRAGKTTTIHVLLGFTEPTSGSAHLFGRDVRETIARERIGYLPELPITYGFLTGRELLTLAGRLFLMPPATLREAVARVIKLVDWTRPRTGALPPTRAA